MMSLGDKFLEFEDVAYHVAGVLNCITVEQKMLSGSIVPPALCHSGLEEPMVYS